MFNYLALSVFVFRDLAKDVLNPEFLEHDAL